MPSGQRFNPGQAHFSRRRRNAIHEDKSAVETHEQLQWYAKGSLKSALAIGVSHRFAAGWAQRARRGRSVDEFSRARPLPSLSETALTCRPRGVPRVFFQVAARGSASSFNAGQHGLPPCRLDHAAAVFANHASLPMRSRGGWCGRRRPGDRFRSCRRGRCPLLPLACARRGDGPAIDAGNAEICKR